MMRFGRLPYKIGGDGFTAIDCVSLVLCFFDEFLGDPLPKSPWQWRKHLRRLSDDEPRQYGDILVMMGCNRLNIADHVAVMIDQQNFVHALQAANGVVCQRLSQYDRSILTTLRAKNK